MYAAFKKKRAGFGVIFMFGGRGGGGMSLFPRHTLEDGYVQTGASGLW